MNPESSDFGYNPEKENKKLEASGRDKEKAESKELSLEEKKQLAEAWCDIVLGKGDCFQDIETMGSESIKQWMHDSLMQEIELLVKEWKLEPNGEFIKKIQEEQDLENKAKLEDGYIKEVHGKISGIAENFDMDSAEVRWSSWPARMRETKQFNCVGATLLGANLLDKAGIKSYYGMPAGHVANVAQLSNGEWKYIDCLVKKLAKKIKPSEERLTNIGVLKIDDKDIGFRLIPLLKNSEALSSVLENLSLLKKEKINPTMSKETADYISKFQEKFKDIDFSALNRKLYPDVRALEATQEMREESERKRIARSKASGS